jgi:hypothetical protein
MIRVRVITLILSLALFSFGSELNIHEKNLLPEQLHKLKLTSRPSESTHPPNENSVSGKKENLSLSKKIRVEVLDDIDVAIEPPIKTEFVELPPVIKAAVVEPPPVIKAAVVEPPPVIKAAVVEPPQAEREPSQVLANQAIVSQSVVNKDPAPVVRKLSAYDILLEPIVVAGNLLSTKEPSKPILETPPSPELQRPVQKIETLPVPEMKWPPQQQPPPVGLPPIKQDPFIYQKVGLWIFGAFGISSVSLNENLSDVTASYHDQSVGYNFGIGMDLTDKTAIEASFRDTPIHLDNTSVGFSDVNAEWKTLDFKITTTLDEVSNWLGKKLGRSTEMRLLFGFQTHQIPLPLFQNRTNVPVLKTVDMKDLNVGARLNYFFDPRTKATFSGEFQYPVTMAASGTGASLSMSPELLLNGSIGVDKRITPNAWLGLHGYGQYQKFQLKYNDSNTTAQGIHTSVFSTIEVRLTWEW